MASWSAKTGLPSISCCLVRLMLLGSTNLFGEYREQNNVIFSVFTTAGTVILGFLLALAIERRLRGWRIFKVVYFLPVMMSTTVVGLLWGRLYDPAFGPINSVLHALGWAHPPDWLGDA